MNFKKLKKTYIIAEIGVNHNGNIKLAKKLIVKAKEAGADAVKFQTFKASNLALKNTKKTKYQKINTKKLKENHFDMLKKLELKFSDYIELKRFSKTKRIDFISTPYDVESAKFLLKIGVKVIKVSSADLVDLSMNRFLSKKKCSVILSLGMADLNEIKKLLIVYKNKNKNEVALLQCVSNYPCSLKSINLNFLKTLKNTKFSFGFSDHSASNLPSIMTIALGGKIIEKHITLSKKMKGPDHKSSLDISEFKKFVSDLRNAEIILGKNVKICQNEEKDMKKISRKSILSKIDIYKGDVFSTKNITFKRPGGGLSPLEYLDKVLGKKAKIFIKKDAQIKIGNF